MHFPHLPKSQTNSESNTQIGILDADDSNDYDLYLYRWMGNYWSIVASSTSYRADETILYSGAPGYYIWRVDSWSGSGSYDLRYGGTQ